MSGGSLVLEEGAQVAVGDSWQGVYLFDNVKLAGNAKLSSADPIRASGRVDVLGTVLRNQIVARDLVVHDGGTLNVWAAAARRFCCPAS